MIRFLIAEEFAEAGFDVREAENGDAAVALIRNSPTAFTLLVTDIHMPGQHDGFAVARLMHRHNPLLPVIYMTGRPAVFNGIDLRSDTEVLVTKPFVPSQLLREAHRLLAKRANDPVH